MRRQSYFRGLPTFKKEAGIKLPDISQWEQSILTIFTRQFPRLASMASLTLTKIDENNMNATGYIKVEPDRNIVLSFPIVIKKGNLSPFDIFSYQNKIYPVQRMTEVLSKHERIGKLITKPRVILVKLATTVSKEEKKNFFKKIAEDPFIDEGLRKRVNLLYDFARTPQVSFKKRFDERVVKLAKDVSKKDVSYWVQSFNQIAANNVWGEKVSKSDFDKIASGLGAQDSFVDNECFVIASQIEDQRKYIHFEKIADTKFISDDKTDIILCEAMSTEGKVSKGWKFNKVFNFDNKVLKSSLFVGNIFNAFQEKIAVKPIAVSPEPLREENELGKGVFVKKAGRQLQASIPINITTKRTINNVDCYKAVDLGGKKYNLIKVAGFKEIKKSKRPQGFDKFFSDDGRGTVEVYYIPDSWKFLSLQNDFVKLSQEKALADNIRKRVDASLTISYRKSDDQYIMRGDLKDVLAKKDLGKRVLSMGTKEIETTLPASASEVFLVRCGMTPLEARKYLGEAKKAGKVILSIVKTPPEESVEKIGEKQKEKWITFLKRDLLKECAVIPDSNSVDKMLSLNFVNKENLSMIVNSVTDFEDTERKLAGMLLASRLGALTIPETALKNALTNISEVTDKLKEIKFITGQQKK